METDVSDVVAFPTVLAATGRRIERAFATFLESLVFGGLVYQFRIRNDSKVVPLTIHHSLRFFNYTIKPSIVSEHRESSFSALCWVEGTDLLAPHSFAFSLLSDATARLLCEQLGRADNIGPCLEDMRLKPWPNGGMKVACFECSGERCGRVPRPFHWSEPPVIPCSQTRSLRAEVTSTQASKRCSLTCGGRPHRRS